MKENPSWREAERVVRAYRAAHGVPSGVAVVALAATLGATAEEVRRLAGSRLRFVDRSDVRLGLHPGRTVTGTSGSHAFPARNRGIVVIDLAAGMSLPGRPEGEPSAPTPKNL